MSDTIQAAGLIDYDDAYFERLRLSAGVSSQRVGTCHTTSAPAISARWAIAGRTRRESRVSEQAQDSGLVVCDNCGSPNPTVTTPAGRFCDEPCVDAYVLGAGHG